MAPQEARDGTPTAWSVGLLDENEMRAEVTAKWIKEGLPCDVATSRTDLLNRLDRTCIVVCMRDTDHRYDGLVRDIWGVSPHTQILVLLDRGALTGLDRTCDDTLQEPYGKDDLQQTVRRLFGRGLYNLRVQQYYQLTSYLAGQEDLDGEAVEKTLEEVREHCARIEAEIEEIRNTFERTDFEDTLLSHRQREKALGTSSMDAEEGSRSKYQPSTCPNCGLTWGAAHGGRLGKGYERIAALVWRCLGCSEVRSASAGEYNKIL